MINKVGRVCDVFLPGCEKPINADFTFLGELFSICTYRFMRGHWGLHGDETPEGYFISCSSEWLDFHADVYPERGEYRIRSEINKKVKRSATAEELGEYMRKADEIKSAFVEAIVSESNEDRVRKMSIEELADLFSKIENGDPENHLGKDGWLVWLKMEGKT